MNDVPNLSPGTYPIDNRLLPGADTIRFMVSGPDADYQQAFSCEANNDLGESDPDGWVEIREISYDAGNVVDRISFDFQVFCNDNSFWGSVQIGSDNYTSLAVPVADAGNLTFVRSGSTVRLSALQSVIPPGQTVTYRWRQLSGEPAIIEDDTSAVAMLRVPRVGASHNPVMIIELEIAGTSGFFDRDQLELFLLARTEDEEAPAQDDGNVDTSSRGASGAGSFPAALLLLMAMIRLAGRLRQTRPRYPRSGFNQPL